MYKNFFSIIGGTIGYVFNNLSSSILAESIVCLIIIIAISIKTRAFNIKLNNFYSNFFKKTILDGIPFTINYTTRTIVSNIDRWFVAGILGISLLGEYSFSMIVFSVAVGIQNIIGTSFGTKIIEKYYKSFNLNTMLIATRELQAKVLFISIPILILGTLITPTFLNFFFSQYFKTYPIILITSFSSLIHLLNFYEPIFIVSGNGRKQILITIIITSATILGLLLSYIYSKNLLSVAIVFLANRILSFFITKSFAYNIVLCSDTSRK